jgi:hypothetical protein
MRSDVEQQLGFDLGSLLTIEQLEILGYACGGLPGLMWRLVAEAEQRCHRLGLEAASAELVRAVVIDIAGASATAFSDEDVERAVRLNALDFELEARGAVLFYVIEGQLRTLRHPLSMLAEQFRIASERALVAPARA